MGKNSRAVNSSIIIRFKDVAIRILRQKYIVNKPHPIISADAIIRNPSIGFDLISCTVCGTILLNDDDSCSVDDNLLNICKKKDDSSKPTGNIRFQLLAPLSAMIRIGIMDKIIQDDNIYKLYQGLPKNFFISFVLPILFIPLVIYFTLLI